VANEKTKVRARKAHKAGGSAAARTRPASAPAGLTLGPRNYAALGAALVSILLGFLLLSRGSITAAPILLVLGYCVLVPYGLAAGRGSGEAGPATEDPQRGE
jgi:hypothetical protein